MANLTGKQCQCAVCNQLFTTESNFDLHRVGPYEKRSCLTPEQLVEKGLIQNAKGFWQGQPNPLHPKSPA